MDHALRCNEMKCRAELRGQALVTTCSHIFCIDCGNRTGLTGASPNNRACPACQSQLPRPDDAIVTVLDPSEDYKTSVLSGLSPEAIMECAGRALSFWSYQMTQDLIWESHRCKVLTNRYNDLKATLDGVVNDANAQLSGLQNRIAGMAVDQETLRRKNEEISSAYKEKNRKLLQVQELYDKLKRKAMLGQIQNAASDAVDTTLHGETSFGVQPVDNIEPQAPCEQQIEPSYNVSRYPDRYYHEAGMHAPAQMAPPDNHSVPWARSANLQVNLPSTPSTHRRRPGHDGVGLSAVPGLVTGTPVALHGTGQVRQPLREMQHNQRSSHDTFTGVGLSSRLKTSQGPATAAAFVPTVRPRVAQRPNVPAFGAATGGVQPGVGTHFNSSV